MISKNLYFKLIKQDLQKRIWCPVLIFIGYFLLLEVRLLMMLDKIESNPYYAKLYSGIEGYVAKEFFGTNTAVYALTGCCAAFLCAMSGFSYLHSKTQLDAYHSLPVSRTQLFISKYVSGILCFIIPYALHTFASVGICAGKGILSAAAFGNAMDAVGVTLLVFLLSYAVFIMAVCLTGNMIISTLASAVLFCYSTIWACLMEALFVQFFETYPAIYDNNKSVYERFWAFSPCSMLIKLFTQHTAEAHADEWFRYNGGYLWVIAAAAVVCTGIAFVLYRLRASEAAGKAIAYHWAEPVIKTGLVIPAAFYTGVLFRDIVETDSRNVWYLFGVIFGYLIFALLLEAIFRLDIKSALHHKRQLAFNAACVALIFIVFRYDAFGFDTYVPESAELESCAVSIEGLMATAPAEIVDRGYYYSYYAGGDVDDYRMENVKLQGNGSVMELAVKAAAEWDRYLKTHNEEQAGDEDASYRSILFGYNLKNGKSVYRRYMIDITDAEMMELLAEVFNDSSYKTGTNVLLSEGVKKDYEKLYCMGRFKEQVMDMTPALQTKLLETYREEYMELDFFTVLEACPVGGISLMTREEYDYCEKDDYYFSRANVSLIYPQFTKTIALLKENGFDIYETLSDEEINSVKVEYYAEREDEYGTYYDLVYEADIDDVLQRRQVLEAVLAANCAQQVTSYADLVDKDIQVYINDNSDSGGLYYYQFKKDMVPEFIDERGE